VVGRVVMVMRVMFDVTDPDQRKHTMTERKGKAEGIDVHWWPATTRSSGRLFARRSRRCWKGR
jgi:hypothetical protein